MISILIPIYNGIEFLTECINSIRKQTFQEWEILIGINGHFNDKIFIENLKKIVNDREKIRIFNFNFQGKVKTLNELVKLTKYNIICLIDADDYWHKNKLREQLDIKNKYPNIDIIGTWCWYIDDKSKLINKLPKLPCGILSNNDFLVNPIINSSVMLNKIDCLWNEKNDNGEDLFGIEDYYLWLKLKLKNKTFFNIEKRLTFHRLYENSFFNNKNNNLKPLEYLKKLLDRKPIF